jgi:hypothetical protein
MATISEVLATPRRAGGGVSLAAPLILTTALPDGEVGVPYSQDIVLSGVPEPSLSVSVGTLPSGLTLTKTSALTWRISGTPASAATASFTLRAENHVDPVDAQAYTFEVVSALSAPTSILADGQGTGGTALTLIPTISWVRSAEDPADGSVTYAVRIYYDAGLSGEVALTGNEGINNTSYAVSPADLGIVGQAWRDSVLQLLDTPYYVTVEAVESGGTPVISAALDFKVNLDSTGSLRRETARAALYQDTGTATPAVANGEPIGHIVRKGSAAGDYLQATAGLRPTLTLNALDTLPALSFDGNQYMQMESAGLGLFRNASKRTVIMLIRYRSHAAVGIAFNASHASLAGTARGSIRVNTSAYEIQGRRPDTGSSATSSGGGTPSDTRWLVQTGVWNYVGSSQQLRIDGNEVDSDALAPTGTTNTTDSNSNAITLGAQGAGNNRVIGDIVEKLVYSETLSTDYRDAVEYYLKGLAGLNASIDIGTYYQIAGFADPDGISVGDIDGDGETDILTLTSTGSPALRWIRQISETSWQMYIAATFTGKLEGCYLADVDGDGELEAVVLNQTEGKVHLAKYSGSPTSVPWATANQIATGTRMNLQSAYIYDWDGDGRDEIMYAHEGTTSGNGGIFILDLNEGGDPLDPVDWTEYPILAMPGAWGIAANNRKDLSGSGRGDIVFSARKLRNSGATPGIYWIECPVNPFDAWTLHTIDTTNVDWTFCDMGNYFGNGHDKDIVAIVDTSANPALCIRIFNFSSGWAATNINNPYSSTIRRFIVSSSPRTVNGRNTFYAGFDLYGLFEYTWNGSAWVQGDVVISSPYTHPFNRPLLPMTLESGREVVIVPDTGGGRVLWLEVEA